MGSLTIRLLGIPEILHGGRRLSFRTRKVLALLVYLVVEGGMHSRESLMALLWPESSSGSAATTLRVTLSRLRKSLQPAGDALVTEAGKVGFDSSLIAAYDLGWLAEAMLPETSPENWIAVLDLDRGEFLEGFSLPDASGFDNWATVQREACQRQLETAYDRLSQHLLAIHNNAAAVEAAARWVARAPFSEQAYRRLMAAQALSGERPAALQTYQQLQATLQGELGIAPSRETVVLADNIELGRVVTDRSAPSPMRSSVLSTDRRHRLTLPLVGRSDEHSRLVTAYHQTTQDGASAVALIGAAGVGKTRLISAFQEWAILDSLETEVWQGRAFETGGRLAYQPVVDALRLRLEQVNAPEDLLEDVWLAELSQLMPELRARYPDLPPPMTGDAGFVRTRLFEAIATLGSALTARQSAVFILDDMQWADADTLDLVHYLSRRWTEIGAPILLLLAIRQEAYAADAALREWLTRVERDVPLTRLLLDSLSGAAVEHLVSDLAREGADEAATSAFAAWLWAETRGLPFFIEALLGMLVEQGILTAMDESQPLYDFAPALDHVRSVARVPLPPGIREVIRARLAQHSKEAGGLLLAAAVLGRACTFERLCQVADLPEMEALETLESLLDGRMMIERPSDRQPYTLAHDYIREVVYTESHEARRRLYHRRALLALEAVSEPAAECAYHALAALLDEPAFRFSVAAGSEAFAAYALQDALSHFDAARKVARRMQARGEVVVADLMKQLYLQRGQTLELDQQDEAARANYEEMQAEAVKRQNQMMELAALIAQSNLHGHYTGVFNPLKSKELAQAALALAQEVGDRETEARALWALQIAELYSAGDSRQVEAYGQQALALARELGLKELQGLVLNNLCWPFGAQKPLQQLREVLKEAQAIWRELGNLPRLAEASRFMLLLHHMAGDHRRILMDAPELAKLGAAIGSRIDAVEPLGWLAFTLIRQGRFGQALDYLDQYGAYAESLGHPNERHAHQRGRMKLFRAAGALEEAERWADELHADRETIPPNFITNYFVDVARVKIACGKLDEGRAILDELVPALPPDAPWSHNIIDIMLGYGELHLALGQPEVLFAELEQRVEPYREAGFGQQLADEYWLRGRAALALGQYDVARIALLEARTAAEAQEERAVLWPILITMSELERASGDATAADGLRDEAREVVEYILEHAGELRGAFLSQSAVTLLLGET